MNYHSENELAKKILIEESFLRGLLCNGTIDCENSPECPEGTDGCVVDDIIKWHKKELQTILSNKKKELMEEAREMLKTKSVRMFYFGEVKEIIDKIMGG